MTSKKTFYDQEHADRYLRNSIITLKGEPIFIHKVGKKGRVDIVYYYVAPFDGSLKTIACNDGDIDITPIPLGLTNTMYRGSPRVIDISRTPSRNWKVGLTKSNIKVKCLISGEELNGEKYIPSVELCSTVKNKYPSYKIAVETMKEMREGTIAFSRIFAIQSDLSLMHKHFTERVGSHGSGVPQLSEKYNWMAGILQESLNA